MMLAGAPPWLPYLTAAAKGAGRAVPRTQAQRVAQPAKRIPSPAGPRAGAQTRQGFLKGGGVYGGGIAGGIPSLAPRRGPAIAPGFDLL
jgi:hypothetical protein